MCSAVQKTYRRHEFRARLSSGISPPVDSDRLFISVQFIARGTDETPAGDHPELHGDVRQLGSEQRPRARRRHAPSTAEGRRRVYLHRRHGHRSSQQRGGAVPESTTTTTTTI